MEVKLNVRSAVWLLLIPVMASSSRSSYISTLPEERYVQKIKEISKKNYDSSVDPYEIADGWVDDISLWPPVEYGCIYTYLIETPGPYTKEKMKAYKSLDAYNFYIK